MGGAINRSLISAHFSISAYFLTVQTYKCMCLTTRVWIGDKVNVSSGTPAGHLWIDISVSADAGCQAIPQWHLHAAGCRHLTPVCARTSDCIRHLLVNSTSSRELIGLLLPLACICTCIFESILSSAFRTALIGNHLRVARSN